MVALKNKEKRKKLKRFFNPIRNQKGFTLIELLIVIAVLGVLAAVIVPNVGKFVGSSKVTAANMELAQVKTAAAAYVADINPSTDFGNTEISTYTSGTIQGTYTFDKNGTLYETGAKKPTGYTGRTWNDTTNQWD
jgi:type IV pilus assembly protein PilA